jgi:hypothetical protein
MGLGSMENGSEFRVDESAQDTLFNFPLIVLLKSAISLVISLPDLGTNLYNLVFGQSFILRTSKAGSARAFIGVT